MSVTSNRILSWPFLISAFEGKMLPESSLYQTAQVKEITMNPRASLHVAGWLFSNVLASPQWLIIQWFLKSPYLKCFVYPSHCTDPDHTHPAHLVDHADHADITGHYDHVDHHGHADESSVMIRILKIKLISLIMLTLLTTVATLFMCVGWVGWMRSQLHSIGVADYGPRKAWPVLDKTHCYNVPNTN